MASTIARIKQKGKHFEIIVNMEEALKFKKGQGSGNFLESEFVFTDSKRGLRASNTDLVDSFGTSDINSISNQIVKSGEIMLSQEHRDEEREKKYKRVVDFLAANSIDPKTGNPHTPDRIKRALEEAHVNVKNAPIEGQIKDIVADLSKILPIKMEQKHIIATIPAQYTGSVYGLIKPYMKNEEWLSNGDLKASISIPSGASFEFYDKLNSITHGSVLTEEVDEK
jgi:ribosome maturation protein SDO1